jgi:hypothetical protein
MKLCQTILVTAAASLFATAVSVAHAADVDPILETGPPKPPAPTVSPAPLQPAPSKPAAPPALPKSTPEIDKYIRQLGDRDFRKRDEAVRELRRIGRPAVDALNVALKASDPEVVSRAQCVLSVVAPKPGPAVVPYPVARGSGRFSGPVGGGVFIPDRARFAPPVGFGRTTTRIQKNADGSIEMSVTKNVNGQPETKTYKAASVDDLAKNHPEAFELFQRLNGRVRAPAPARPHVELLPIAPPGLGPGDPEAQAEAQVRGMLEELRRMQAQRQADRQGDAKEMLERLERHRAQLQDPQQPQPNNLRTLGVKILEHPNVDGLVVTGVVDDTAAARMKIEEGDVIRKINGRRVTNRDELRRALDSSKGPFVVELTRDGKPMKITEKAAEPTTKP